MGEYLERCKWAWLISKYVSEAASESADAKLRHEAIALAEEALGPGNEALERRESAGADGRGGWWR